MIRAEGAWFKDEQGRTLLLRGVNLGGSSKVPTRPDGATHRREGFFDHRDVSFVGRPFPLDEADEHLARLRAWGLTFLRLLVTWEAIEHAGPGIYDEAYLDYITAVARKAGEHGFVLFIDPHQDVWSRFSGGDGAPGWTFEAVGMDITRFAETGAALVHAMHQGPLPRMSWPSNGARLAAATMFTLFFGGDDFAPRTTVEGEPVQQYLQRHYIEAVRQVALRLKDMPHVIGYDTLNEPIRGYIGWRNLRDSAEALLRLGESPSPLQAMLLGAGHPQEVDVWAWGRLVPRRAGTRLVNAGRARAWAEGRDCIWRQNGVWDGGADGTPQLLRPDHFSVVRGRAVDFEQDYLRPFANRFASAIRTAHPDALIFLEPAVGDAPPRWGEGDAAGIVYAPHWYDVAVLMGKSFTPWLGIDTQARRPVLGPGAVRRSYARQLRELQREGAERLGATPFVLGEFGIPFDLDQKRAYRTGDFSAQLKAMDRSWRAVEDALCCCTLWNYTPDNTNQHGDLWNDEDLSIFSRDQQSNPQDLNSGGRALRAVMRPYALRTAGQPLRMSFDWRRRTFEYEFRHDPGVEAPTELFLPASQYPRGYEVRLSDGFYEVDRQRQLLIYHHTAARETHEIHICPT